MQKSLQRIGKQAKGMNYFKDIFLYNEFRLASNFRDKFQTFLTYNTFYLCAWKPQVIIQSFNKMNFGDILLYADAGCHLNKNGIARLTYYIDRVSKSKSGILASQMSSNEPELKWTKGDTFDYFNARDNKSITHTPVIQATAFFLRKDENTIFFIENWLKVFEEDPKLADRGYFRRENLEGFLDHRSDQSFFSIMSKKMGIELFSAEEVQGSANWEEDMIVYPVWAKRDKEISYAFIYSANWLKIKKEIKRIIYKIIK